MTRNKQSQCDVTMRKTLPFAWPETTDIINIPIRCEFAYHVVNLASSAINKLYYAML